MANAERGELEFDTTDGRTYTLQFSMGRLADIEEKLGRSHIAVFEEISRWGKDLELVRVKTLGTLFWAGLKKHHPELSVDDAIELIVPSGGVVNVFSKVMTAIGRAFPTTETKGENPPEEIPTIGAVH